MLCRVYKWVWDMSKSVEKRKLQKLYKDQIATMPCSVSFVFYCEQRTFVGMKTPMWHKYKNDKITYISVDSALVSANTGSLLNPIPKPHLNNTPSIWTSGAVYMFMLMKTAHQKMGPGGCLTRIVISHNGSLKQYRERAWPQDKMALHWFKYIHTEQQIKITTILLQQYDTVSVDFFLHFIFIDIHIGVGDMMGGKS